MDPHHARGHVSDRLLGNARAQGALRLADDRDMSSSRLDPGGLDVVLDALLANYPRALVVATSPEGRPATLEEPLSLTGQQLIEGHTASQLVVPDDVLNVVEAWHKAIATGSSITPVHLTSDPEKSVMLHFVDAVHRHGVYVGLFLVQSTEEALAALGDMPTLRPRVGVIQKDQVGFIREADDATAQLLGYSPEEMVGRRSLEFMEPEDHKLAIANWMDMLRAPGSRCRARLRHRHNNGSVVWLEVTNWNLLNDPEHGYVITELVDVTEEIAAQEALHEREYLRRLTEALPLGIAHIDTSRRIIYRNQRLTTIFGNTRSGSLERHLKPVVARDRQQVRRAIDAVLSDGHEMDLEIAVRLRSGADERRCSLNLRALTDSFGKISGAIICIADVTESVRMRQELVDRATYDGLTRCYNRGSILSLLDRTLAEPRDGGTGTGVIFIDLDRFKDVNDRLGRAAGDSLLAEVAQRLRSTVRGQDVVGRLGGDEFLVVCREVAKTANLVRIAERIAKILAQNPVQIGAETIAPCASIGLAWSNREETSADALVAWADVAMYESKRQGSAHPVLFTPPASDSVDSLAA
jgi:diguanylate cyclase (GGDEF)-like protein/PAS domain S-box-containing protein